jgi:flagellar protein FliO/FliZ
MVRFIPTPLLLFAMAEACAQASQGAPVTAPVTELGGSLWQLFLGLAMVLALMIGSLWILKKVIAQRGEGAGLLRVVAGTAVGTRERVVIVEVGSTWLVLGVAPGRVSALAEIPRQSAATQSANPDSSPGAGFPDWLRKLTQRR